MIVAEQKPLEEILEILGPRRKIVLAGCNECVTVCHAGGKKEVGVLASTLKLALGKKGEDIEIREVTLERQCDPEYVEELRPLVEGVDAILSIACGCGVQFVAERMKGLAVFPGLNTLFMGATVAQGIWSERCQGCGSCILHLTGGICPVARCSKSLMNGPCGGSMAGKCEVGKDIDCGWQLIVDRLESLGKLDSFDEIVLPKDWSKSRDGGPRKVVREDLK